MTRRKESRIYAEEFGGDITTGESSLEALCKCGLLNISKTGFCVSACDADKLQAGVLADIKLILPGNHCVCVQCRIVKVENAHANFQIVKIGNGEEHLDRFIEGVLTERARRNIHPPRKWADAEQHFSSTLGHSWYNLLFRIYGEIVYATNDFYRKRKYVPALMPITVESVSSPMGLGSDSLPVKVDLFGKSTYLADSMQFQLEYLLRQNAPGVFYIMPTFRGEDPDTRHLNQFFHSEAEIQGTLEDVMPLIEEYLAELSESMLVHFEKDIARHAKGDISHIKYFLSRAGKLPRVSYEEAGAMLGNNPDYYSNLSGGLKCVSRQGEQELMRRFKGFVWIIYPPHGVVPFYQAFTADGRHARAADLLMGIGETVGCGERHVGHTELKKALDLHNVAHSEYAWYIHMKEAYPMQSSGFGLGLERYLLWLLRHDDIRDMAIFSRLKGIRAIP